MTADPVASAVASALGALSGSSVVVIAFSGGLDSSVLLRACVEWARGRPCAHQILACHVHHGLQPAADAFAAHAEREAQRLGVRFELRRATGRPAKGESIEAWARDARYRALVECSRDVHAAALLTAHHSDDQAETLLIGLARGSGLDGLSGVRGQGELGGVTLLRPLLGVPKAELLAYAERHSIHAIEDPMNADPNFLRVALRGQVMPVLSRVAPSFVANAARSAALIAEASQVLAELAREDLAQALAAGSTLCLRPLALLSRARQANALRHWLAACGAPMPSQARLAALLSQLFDSNSAHALWRHAGWTVVRYREVVWICAPDASPHPDRPLPGEWRDRWSGDGSITLPQWGLRLRAAPLAQGRSASGFEVDLALLEAAPILVRAPAATLRVRPGPQAASRTVRKRWQERGVPPWLRGWLPEVSVGGRVLGVVGLGIAADARPVSAGECPPIAEARVTLSVEPIDPRDPRARWVLSYN